MKAILEKLCAILKAADLPDMKGLDLFANISPLLYDAVCYGFAQAKDVAIESITKTIERVREEK